MGASCACFCYVLLADAEGAWRCTHRSRARQYYTGQASDAPVIAVRTCSPPAEGTLLLVDHLSGHPAVNHEIGSCHKTRAVAIEEKGDHFRDILGAAHASCRMLEMVLAPQLAFLLTPHDDPAGADAVHPHLGSEADCQSMGQSHEPALAGRIGFGVRLGHQRAGWGNRK